MRAIWALSLAALLAPAALAAGTPSGRSPLPKPDAVSEKEAFMLMFGKGNGAMRVLCALERDGLISRATRQRYLDRLEQLLSEPGDTANDRRNARIGMAFADRRPGLCPERLIQPSAPGAPKAHP
ncbi:hypothetical protein NZK27_04290 [Synechococcus sp. FGCU-3]|nr:hypothetical protein [Synechococcus sp. FGCU3]